MLLTASIWRSGLKSNTSRVAISIAFDEYPEVSHKTSTPALFRCGGRGTELHPCWQVTWYRIATVERADHRSASASPAQGIEQPGADSYQLPNIRDRDASLHVAVSAATIRFHPRSGTEPAHAPRLQHECSAEPDVPRGGRGVGNGEMRAEQLCVTSSILGLRFS